MPIVVQAGETEYEFPDGTPDDVMSRAIRGDYLRAEQQVARAPMAGADRVISAVDTVAPLLGRISLGGLGRITGALAADALTSPVPGYSPALAAELTGQPRPVQVQSQLDDSVLKEGLVGAASVLPTIGAAAALGPLGAPAWASMAIPMGAQAFEQTEGDPFQAAKAAALGAAVPMLGSLGRLGAGALTGAAVNRGATVLANPTVQRGIEAVGGAIPIEAAFAADLMTSPEYRSASPEQRERMLKVNAIQSAVFGVNDAIQASRPRAVVRDPVEPKVVPETLVTEPDVPLGLNRPTIADTTLRDLTDEKFDSVYRERTKFLDQLESQWDKSPESVNRSELASAQDAWESANLERFRRNLTDMVPEDLFRKLREAVSPIRGDPLDPLNSENFQKSKLILEELNRQGAKTEDVTGGIRLSTADHAEVFKDDLGKIKNVLAAMAEPEPTVRSEPPSPAEGFNPAEGQKVRSLSERASESPDVPKPVQDAIRKDPRSLYDPQVVADEVDAASQLSDAELAAGMADPESNTAVLQGLELANRAIASGNNTGATQIIQNLAERGTTLGQLVNQFKLLRGSKPEYVADITDQFLKRKGYDALKPKTRQKITDLSKANIEAENNRKNADGKYREDPSPENWRGVEEADQAAGRASIDLNLELARLHPKEMTDTLVAIMQGNTLTPISQVANVAGNAQRSLVDATARTGAALADAVESAVTGKPRTIKVYPVQNTLAKLRALGKTSKVIRDILKHGADTSAYEVGQVGGTRINSPKAIKELWDIFKGQADVPTKGGKVPLLDIAQRFAEATFGLPADIMFRGLGAMDAAFKYPERARLITEAALRKGLTSEQAKRAVERPDLHFTKKEREVLDFETARAVYQQDNAATELMASVNKQLRKVPALYFLSKTVALYQKTPINVLGDLFTYTPLGGIKLINDIRKGNRREANLTASKMAIGSMATAASVWLYQNGLISPPLDTSDEAQKVRLGVENAIPPSHINISGLKRKLAGGDPSPQPGDDLRDMRRLGLGGGIMYITSWAQRQAEKTRESDTGTVSEIVANAPAALGSWALNQTFLSGVSEFIKGITENKVDSWISKWIQTPANIVAPNTLANISRAVRESKPEFRDDNELKAIGNKLNEKANQLGFSVPMGRETKALPLKVDLWGRPMPETPAGANPWVYHFFDITRNREIPDDPVAVDLYKLWRRTSNTAVFPSLPERVLSVPVKDENGKNTSIQTEPVTYDQFQELATLIGQARRAAVEVLVDAPKWPELPDEKKIEFLKAAYDKGRKAGMDEFLSRGPELTPRQERRGTR